MIEFQPVRHISSHRCGVMPTTKDSRMATSYSYGLSARNIYPTALSYTALYRSEPFFFSSLSHLAKTSNVSLHDLQHFLRFCGIGAIVDVNELDISSHTRRVDEPLGIGDFQPDSNLEYSANAW